LGEAGASVVLAARTGAQAEANARQIGAAGGKAVAMTCDVSNYAACQHLVHETTRHFGPPDVLVNNAGVIEPIGMVGETDPTEWARSIEVNLIGAYYAIRAVLPGMQALFGFQLIAIFSDRFDTALREVEQLLHLLAILLVALAIALIFVPFASIVTYPCNLFVTLVHESSHALAALAPDSCIVIDSLSKKVAPGLVALAQVRVVGIGKVQRRDGGFVATLTIAGVKSTVCRGGGLRLDGDRLTARSDRNRK
jgi:NAD(P)-dependent dehydrogenase (short-subunit alcohol dehydrogenase family)